ncbi:MAG: F0F1 ATP synthase subunit gamma [Eubacteriales bacterium]|nr:F0F1 ATP synthase subunit gamma [Eubacteriales bacterium]
MASLEQLKKKFKSVELTKQLTGAMKTVSSAKYSRVSKAYTACKIYTAELEKLAPYCSGIELSKENSKHKKKDLFVIIGHNRGLCGAYNSELHSFATSVLSENPDCTLIVCGKNAIAYFEGKKTEFEKFILGDVTEYLSCKPLINKMIELYRTGKVKSVNVIYQEFVNTLTQRPHTVQVLPLDALDNKQNSEDMLFIPDKESVSEDLEIKVIASKIYKIILEAAIGAQAATLLAMKTAVDHATEIADMLENEIHKKRQSSVTNGVIETGAASYSEED